jgi:hypothetical protein
MTAQAQECVYGGLSLPAPAAPNDSLAQLRLAQEAAQVRPRSPTQDPRQSGPQWAGGKGQQNRLGEPGQARMGRGAMPPSPALRVSPQSQLLSWLMEP